MTDKQFNSHLRELLSSLKKALAKSPDNEEIQEMIERYQADLED